jgi:plasmid stabilization system protein ParE
MSLRKPIDVSQELAAIRSQAAVVRALLDELERLLRYAGTGAPREQLLEELARLGNRTCAAAAALTPEPVEPEATSERTRSTAA